MPENKGKGHDVQNDPLDQLNSEVDLLEKALYTIAGLLEGFLACSLDHQAAIFDEARLPHV